MKEEFPKVKSISEGIEKLFPFLTESQRKELERGLKAALIKEIGRIWGEREISEDRMREEIRKELEKEVKDMKSIPEDEKRRIVDRLSRFIPAEELVILKGKIKQSALKRYKLKRILVNSFLEMLRRNLGIEDEGGEKKRNWGMLKDMRDELEDIRKKLEDIKNKLPDHTKSKTTEEEGMERKERELEQISEELDEIVKRIEEKKVVDEGALKEIKREFEEIKGKIKEAGEVKKPEEVEEKLDKALEEIEFECMEILKNEIKNLDPYKYKKKPEEESEEEKIEKLIEEIENKIKEKEKEEKIGRKLGRIRDGIKRNLSLMGILEEYGVKDELEKLCEELETSVNLSAEIEEGLEDIIVKNMNKMVRKDLSLYISWRVGNPLREFYYKVKRGEEI